MKLDRVDSSAVTSIGYDPVKRIVRVIFASGGVYDYFDVPATVYETVRNAESIGTAVNQVLKQYRFERVR